jgi:glycosyltransferase involved in cell wall biosynthesis
MLASLGVGGAEKQVLALAQRMAERGHAVTLVTLLPKTEQEWPYALPVIRLNLHKNPFSLMASFMRGRDILGELKPDVVHSHSFHANVFARLVSLFAGRPAVISTVHNVYEGGWPRMLAYRFTDGLCAHTTAVSQAAADRFIKLKSVRAKKCSVILNAIDLSEFTPDVTRRKCVRDSLNTGDDFLWLAAGRITAAKDYPNLLGAFARVLKVEPNACLLIAGQGSGIEIAKLQILAERLGITRCIQCLGLRRDLPALLNAADGFVLSSAWEGMPLAIAEAMAMEKPVVATDVGGVGELIGDAGFVVPAQNSEALADAMLTVMRKPEAERSAFGRAARRRIQVDFNIDSRVEEWESLYRSLTSKAL